MNRNWTIVLAVLVGGAVAAALAAWAVRELGGDSATDQAMAALRAQPLMGLVMADNPAIEARLRATVEEDLRQPQTGPSRSFLAITEIRRTVVGPTLAAADDAAALTVMTARTDLVGYLQKTDLAACRQFANEGIHDINKLDGEGQRRFRAMLTAMEAAYRNGKANGGKSKAPSNEEFAAMLKSAGFTPDDFAKFTQTATLPDAELCTLEFRIDDAPSKLPEDKRGAFARFVIAH
jgi:hypothetical protein